VTGPYGGPRRDSEGVTLAARGFMVSLSQSPSQTAVRPATRTSSAAAIRFEAVTRRFGEVVALDGIDLTIDIR